MGTFGSRPIPPLDDPAFDAFDIAPNDGADLAHTTRGIYVGIAGTLKVTMLGGTTVTFYDVPIGILPIRVTKVFATGTSADELIGLV